MLLRGIFRAGFVPAIFIAASLIHAGCSNGQDVHYASISGDSAKIEPTASPTLPPTPNPDQAAGLITRFYRDIDTGTKQSILDLATIASRDFFRNHHDDIVANYAFIQDPKVQIRDIHDRTVSYSLDYIYLTKGNGRLFWERTGHWTLNHGAHSGWVLDNDVWDSVHLIGVAEPGQTNMTPVQDNVFSDGRHEFTYEGQTLSFLANGNGWHITPVSTPTPTVAHNSNAGAGSNGEFVPDNQEVAGATYQPLPPSVASADCEEVGVEDIYDDGKILALDDGRHLSVADSDTVISSVWVAPFDGLICNEDRFINKDENEAVDLAY